jgi:hypothetical protein
MDPLSKIISANGKGFDGERRISPSDTAGLLARRGQTTVFDVLEALTRAWRHHFSEFRSQMNLQIASQDSDIVLAIRKASDMHINTWIYQIDQRDIMPPDLDRPWWDVYGTKTGEIYVPTP